MAYDRSMAPYHRSRQIPRGQYRFMKSRESLKSIPHYFLSLRHLRPRMSSRRTLSTGYCQKMAELLRRNCSNLSWVRLQAINTSRSCRLLPSWLSLWESTITRGGNGSMLDVLVGQTSWPHSSERNNAGQLSLTLRNHTVVQLKGRGIPGSPERKYTFSAFISWAVETWPPGPHKAQGITPGV